MHLGLNNPTDLLLHLREGPCTVPYSDKNLKDSQAFNPAAFPGLREGCRKSLKGCLGLKHCGLSGFEGGAQEEPQFVFRPLFHTDKDLPGLREDSQRPSRGLREGPGRTSNLWKVRSPADLPGLREDPVRTLNPLEGPFSGRPSRFERGPSKNLKPSGKSLLWQTFQV
jgi:hypothetical protein